MEKICIVGAGGFAREVAWLIEEINRYEKKYEFLGYIDDNSDNIGKELNGYKVLGNIEYLNSLEQINVVIAIGNGKIREEILKKIKNKKYPKLIHPDVKISNYTTVGEGSIICAGNILTVNIEIGEHVIINLDCTVGHDTILKNYTTILPGAHISGNVTIGERTTIGTGAAIIQGIGIGSDTMIGAGSVVSKEIPQNCTAVGVPAKVIKTH